MGKGFRNRRLALQMAPRAAAYRVCCPHCGHAMELASAVSEAGARTKARPKSGDIGICIRCAGAYHFGAEGTPALALDDLDILALPLTERLTVEQAQAAIRAVAKGEGGQHG